MISVVEIGYVRRSELKQAPGLNKIEVNCGSCHSLDYIPMNSPFLNSPGGMLRSPK
jgi:hypothetical protein